MEPANYILIIDRNYVRRVITSENFQFGNEICRLGANENANYLYFI